MKQNKAQKWVDSVISIATNENRDIREYLQNELNKKFGQNGKSIPPEYKDAIYEKLGDDFDEGTEYSRSKKYDKKTPVMKQFDSVLNELEHMKKTMYHEDMVEKMRRDIAGMEYQRRQENQLNEMVQGMWNILEMKMAKEGKNIYEEFAKFQQKYRNSEELQRVGSELQSNLHRVFDIKR